MDRKTFKVCSQSMNRTNSCWSIRFPYCGICRVILLLFLKTSKHKRVYFVFCKAAQASAVPLESLIKLSAGLDSIIILKAIHYIQYRFDFNHYGLTEKSIEAQKKISFFLGVGIRINFYNF